MGHSPHRVALALPISTVQTEGEKQVSREIESPAPARWKSATTSSFWFPSPPLVENLNHMNTPIHNLASRIRLLTTVLLALAAMARSADTNALKDAYKDHFYVGAAINGTLARGSRPSDAALVKEQFNQIVPENDLKWQSIQPRPGPNGYNFGPADAFVNFGLSNNMYLVGHTLVWQIGRAHV